MKPMRGFGYKELHEYYLISVNGSSTIQKNELLEVTVHCNYELGSFPFDYQECDFSLTDQTNTVESLILNEIGQNDLCYKGTPP